MLTIDHITAALALGPLGDRSDFDLMPETRERYLNGRKTRPAAVLCGLIQREDGLHVVLTERAAHLKEHAGQISFPGGKVDPADPGPKATALREAEEEIGLPAHQIDLLGPLDDYVTGTAFRVTPFVGLVDVGWQPVLDPGEVARVFETPLDFLMDSGNRLRHAYTRDGMTRYYYAMPWNDHYIWGATAGMLKGLADRLELIGAAR
ncbi:MAG: CoA pyrophosphatase [Pseudomonadota bacterium]